MDEKQIEALISAEVTDHFDLLLAQISTLKNEIMTNYKEDFQVAKALL